MNCLVAIVGPTAVGKSRLAIELARDFHGEIVSADSRHVYRHMDIGTNKPTAGERAAVPHHLIDLISPDEPFSLAHYKELAVQAVQDIQQRGRVPLLVGGTGLYVWAVVENWQVPPVPPDAAFREGLEARAMAEGTSSVYQELERIDPTAATRIGHSNLRRMIRALEVYRATGCLPSQFWQKAAPSFPTLVVGVTVERSVLYQTIDRRVHDMLRLGLLEEVKHLLDMGYDPSLPSMSGIGYRQVAAHLRGELDLTSAVQAMKTETHRFARHQYAWFRPADPRIHWVELPEGMRSATLLVERFLRKHREPALSPGPELTRE